LSAFGGRELSGFLGRFDVRQWPERPGNAHGPGQPALADPAVQGRFAAPITYQQVLPMQERPGDDLVKPVPERRDFLLEPF